MHLMMENSRAITVGLQCDALGLRSKVESDAPNEVDEYAIGACLPPRAGPGFERGFWDDFT